MPIKRPNRPNTVSKKAIEKRELCSAKEMTIVFSFRHLSSNRLYNFRYFDKMKKHAETTNAIVQLVEKISEMSKMTWEEFNQKAKGSGLEYIDVASFEKQFTNSVDIPLPKDDKLIVVRFNSQRSRLIIKGGTKCPRVAHVLGIDYDLITYKH